MTDPIADMLTRIRNAYLAGRQQVDLPYSNLKFHVAQKLQQLGYLDSVDHQPAEQTLNLKLKYKNGSPILTHLKRISKPGRRSYSRSAKITPTLSGLGSKILTTSQGILSDVEARKAGIGGEIICEVW